MNDRLSAGQLNERRAQYFMEQQIGLHGTIVAIALGVAGLAAAGLLVVSSADRPYHILFWALWLTALLGVGTVYSGMTVSVYVLPSKIPNVLDMFLPFAIGLMEFMLFAVLTAPLTDQISPRSVVAVWFGCFGLFGCFASLVLRRVRRLFQNSSYDEKLKGAVNNLVEQLRWDLRGAMACSVTGIAVATLIGSIHTIPLTATFIGVTILVSFLILGLISQYMQGTALESKLRSLSSSANGSRKEHVPPP